MFERVLNTPVKKLSAKFCIPDAAVRRCSTKEITKQVRLKISKIRRTTSVAKSLIKKVARCWQLLHIFQVVFVKEVTLFILAIDITYNRFFMLKTPQKIFQGPRGASASDFF